MRFTEGGFKSWGYELAKREFGGVEIDGGPWLKLLEKYGIGGIVIKDVIADAFLQQIQLRYFGWLGAAGLLIKSAIGKDCRL